MYRHGNASAVPPSASLESEQINLFLLRGPAPLNGLATGSLWRKEAARGIRSSCRIACRSQRGDTEGQSSTRMSSAMSRAECPRRRVHTVPNSNDVPSIEMLWERVLSLLVVGASVLGGSAVLLIQALPPLLHGFP